MSVCTEPDLVMSDRQGIEIDYCPKCRGVWLDRGELDKIVERAAAQPEAAQRAPAPLPQNPPPRGDEYRRHPGDYRHHDEYRGRKRRESWLSELFD